jgi:hypothetical protein
MLADNQQDGHRPQAVEKGNLPHRGVEQIGDRAGKYLCSK